MGALGLLGWGWGLGISRSARRRRRLVDKRRELLHPINSELSTYFCEEKNSTINKEESIEKEKSKRNIQR